LLTELLAAEDFGDRRRGYLVQSALESLAATDLKTALEIQRELPEELEEPVDAAKLVQHAASRLSQDHTPAERLSPEARARLEAADDRFKSIAEAVQSVYGDLPPPEVLGALLSATPSRSSGVEFAESVIDQLRPSGAATGYGVPSSSAFSTLGALDQPRARQLATDIARDAQAVDPDISTEVLYAALDNLRRTDPGAVAGLADGILDERLRPAALKIALETQLDRDPILAANWSEGIPAPDRPARAAELLAEATRYRDPHLSLAWAMRVDDAEKRGRLIAETVRPWSVVDPPAAREAVRSLRLPTEDAATLLELIDRGS
jgi:hypothetical protein